MPEEFRDSVDAGAGNQFDDAVDIGTVAAAAPEPDRKPGKRRGRPPGSGNAGSGGAAKGTGKEKASHKLDLSSLTGLFVGLHVVAASALNTPELAMDMAEGDQFMKSAQNVMRHYSVESSQKTIDWISFGGTCAMLYGTRFGAYMLRKRTEGREEVKPRGYTVVQSPASKQAAPQSQPAPGDHITVEMEFDGTE